MSKLIWIILAFVAGALLPVQGGMNAKLGKSIASPVYASMISFVVGAAVLVVYILIARQSVTISGFRTAPAYVWLAGALGAFYVTAVILAFPKIGPALTFGLVVAGQMAIAVTLEHFNVMVVQQHSINIWRVLGMVLILVGVVIIRRY